MCGACLVREWISQTKIEYTFIMYFEERVSFFSVFFFKHSQEIFGKKEKPIKWVIQIPLKCHTHTISRSWGNFSADFLLFYFPFCFLVVVVVFGFTNSEMIKRRKVTFKLNLEILPSSKDLLFKLLQAELSECRMRF